MPASKVDDGKPPHAYGHIMRTGNARIIGTAMDNTGQQRLKTSGTFLFCGVSNATGAAISCYSAHGRYALLPRHSMNSLLPEEKRSLPKKRRYNAWQSSFLRMLYLPTIIP
jgi:hypothetical protein